MATLTRLGLLELAVAAWSGWWMVLATEQPALLERVGVRHLGRLRQSHLDLLLMGVILTAVGVALRPASTWIVVGLAVPAYLQPLMFLPLAFSARVRDALAYKAINGALFVVFTAAWGGVFAAALAR